VTVEIRPVAFDIHLPAGVAGPDPIDLDVRCFLVPHATGISLIDTGVAGSAAKIAAALDQIGATWADVSDVLLSHDHPDHVGGLADVVAIAPHATIWGNSPLTAQALDDGHTVRDLRIVATPGHTAGHVSFLHGEGTLFAGDLIGSRDGHLERSPAAFTADAAQAEQSIHKIADLDPTSILFAHGPEIAQPSQALRSLLDN
jgi:glyoxylase-like metal-dependent hydrolase (beta-lactamase superfamily II)